MHWRPQRGGGGQSSPPVPDFLHAGAPLHTTRAFLNIFAPVPQTTWVCHCCRDLYSWTVGQWGCKSHTGCAVSKTGCLELERSVNDVWAHWNHLSRDLLLQAITGFVSFTRSEGIFKLKLKPRLIKIHTFALVFSVLNTDPLSVQIFLTTHEQSVKQAATDAAGRFTAIITMLMWCARSAEQDETLLGPTWPKPPCSAPQPAWLMKNKNNKSGFWGPGVCCEDCWVWRCCQRVCSTTQNRQCQRETMCF